MVIKLLLFVLPTALAAGGLQADINKDGRVDMGDLAILTSQWLMESDMSDTVQVIITGSNAPAAIDGLYDWSSDIAYLNRDDNEYSLIYDDLLTRWTIRRSWGEELVETYFVRNSETVTGEYEPTGEYTGSATVTAQALTITARFKNYAGITGTDDDTLINLLIARATSAIQRYCQRDFILTTYRDFYDGDGGSELCLNHYPITNIQMLGVGREDVIGIRNTSSDAYNAYVTVTDTTIQLVVQGGVNADDSFLTLADYSTITALITAIEALSKGWSCLTPDSSLAIWSPTEILPTGKGLRALDDYAYLQIPNEPEEDFAVDNVAGMIKLFGRYPRGFQNIVVRYEAGYSTIPADLEQICIDLVKIYYDNKSINTSLQGERIGDYQYTNRSNSTGGVGALPQTITGRLEKWKVRHL